MSKPPIADPSAPQQAKAQTTPRWETWTMAGSFVVLWVWFIARQLAYRNNDAFSPLWQIPLFISLGLLIWIFIRRMRRTLSALKEVHPAKRGRVGHN